MKKKHLAIMILAIYFAPMCIKWKMTYMDKQELNWVSQYETGQRMYYISDKKDMDTLEITEKYIYNFCWPISLHIGYNNQFTASCGLHFIIKNNKNKTLNGALGVIKDEQKEPVNLYFYLGDRFALGELTGPEHSFGLPLLKDMCTIRFNGHTFNDCIVIDYRNSGYGADKSTGISKFIWSKSRGLLLYAFENGDFLSEKNTLSQRNQTSYMRAFNFSGYTECLKRRLYCEKNDFLVLNVDNGSMGQTRQGRRKRLYHHVRREQLYLLFHKGDSDEKGKHNPHAFSSTQVSDLCACIKEPVAAGFVRHGFLQSET